MGVVLLGRVICARCGGNVAVVRSYIHGTGAIRAHSPGMSGVGWGRPHCEDSGGPAGGLLIAASAGDSNPTGTWPQEPG